MATALASLCTICNFSYNNSVHRPVTLPCSHAFCLQCLQRLKNEQSAKCPVCRSDWSEFQTEGLAATKKQTPQQDDELAAYFPNKRVEVLCEEHSRTVILWCDSCDELVCKRCVSTSHKFHHFVDLEDDVTCLRTTLEESVYEFEGRLSRLSTFIKNARDYYATKISVMDEIRTKVDERVEDFNLAVQQELQKFSADMRQVKQELEQDKKMFSKSVQDLETLESTHEKGKKLLERLNLEKERLLSEKDLHLFGECQRAIEKISEKLYLPTLQESEVLEGIQDADGVSTVVEATANEFINSVSKFGSSWIQPAHLVDKISEFTADKDNWYVDNECSAYAAEIAASCEEHEPSSVTIVSKVDDELHNHTLSVACQAVRRSDSVLLHFMDTFYKPETGIDNQRLAIFQDVCRDDKLVFFYGHLDAEGIRSISPRVQDLNLAIDNAEDAAAVSQLHVWDQLHTLGVSVSKRVAPEHLQPLPEVTNKRIVFYQLRDSEVDRVWPAIAALVPSLRLNYLCFPKCELTTEGLHKLIAQLSELRVTEELVFVMAKDWQPEEEKMQGLTQRMRENFGGVAYLQFN